MYDIAVIGAGPAGANFARLAGGKYKILLLERQPEQGAGGKCCGGLLAPDAQKMFAALGLSLPREVLVDPQLFAVRSIDLDGKIARERLYQRFYFNMDRQRFVRWLVSLVPGKVDIQFGALCKGFLKTPGGYQISYRQNGADKQATAKILVGADGANSRVRAFLESAPALRRYTAIQEWYPCENIPPYFTAVFCGEVSDFYAWIIPKEGHLLLGAALEPNGSAAERFALLKSKLTPLGFSFTNRIKREGSFIYRPAFRQLYAGSENIALVGEAAGAISPSSAEGISYALKSSLLLAESLEAGTEGFLQRYRHALRGIQWNLALKWAKSPAMYNPLLRRIIMRTGVQSIGAASDKQQKEAGMGE